MASKYYSGEEEEWEMASVRRFHRLQQSLPQRSIPYAQNRLASRCHGWPSSDEFFGCLPGLSSNTSNNAFVTPIENYHYKMMPFGLKNAGSTYQRMMTRMFKSQLGKNIEIYIDDMVVKSKVVSEHLGDLGTIFEILRKYKLRLSAFKCSFGVGSGKFLGYMVTHRGIEVNPN